MRPIDNIREWETDDILISVADWLLYEDRPSITWAEFQNLLRAEPFCFQDERTHRKKRRYLEANGYLKRVNRVAYKITEQGLARVRKAKGVPETHEDALDANASDAATKTDVYEQSSMCLHEPVKSAEWELIRKLILARDGNRCRVCGGDGDGQPLQVQNKQTKAPNGSSEPDDIITICHRCQSGESSSKNKDVAEYLMVLRNGSRLANGGGA